VLARCTKICHGSGEEHAFVAVSSGSLCVFEQFWGLMRSWVHLKQEPQSGWMSVIFAWLHSWTEVFLVGHNGATCYSTGEIPLACLGSW